MSGTAPRASPWGGVELLERGIGYTRGALGHVAERLSDGPVNGPINGPINGRGSVLDAPTPCAQWSLWDLLVHMDDSLVSLHEAGSRRRVDLRPARTTRTAPAALLEGLRRRACQLLSEWSVDWERGHVDGDVCVDGLALTPRVLTSAGALEITVHGWDVAVACGADHPIPQQLATDLLRVAPLVVGSADRPARFAPALSMPSGASPQDRLLAFLGRTPARPVRAG